MTSINKEWRRLAKAMMLWLAGYVATCLLKAYLSRFDPFNPFEVWRFLR